MKGKDRIWRRRKNSLLKTLELCVCACGGGVDKEGMRDADETFQPDEFLIKKPDRRKAEAVDVKVRWNDGWMAAGGSTYVTDWCRMWQAGTGFKAGETHRKQKQALIKPNTGLTLSIFLCQDASQGGSAVRRSNTRPQECWRWMLRCYNVIKMEAQHL